MTETSLTSTSLTPLESFTKECKAKSINALFNTVQQLYNSRDCERLEIAARLYIEYFGKMSDRRAFEVKFNYAFAMFDRNPEYAVQEFEKLLRLPNLPEDIKTYTEWNLEKMYSRAPLKASSIPNIVHLIFLIESSSFDFYPFHYVCLNSILEHLPNHQIIIWTNGREPVNNKYWDTIRNNPRIKFEVIQPPTEFDGFPLVYPQYKADVIRLEKLYEYGGIYMDLDIYLIKNFEHLFKSNRGLYLGFENTGAKKTYPIEGGLINCFLAAKPGNEFLKLWLDSFKTGLRMDNWAYHIRDSNRLLINENPHYLLKYDIELIDSEWFCPIKWSELDKFEAIPNSLTGEQTCGVHLFETITKNTLMKIKLFNPEAPGAA